MPKLNKAKSLVRLFIFNSCRICHISLTLNGRFGPTIFPSVDWISIGYHSCCRPSLLAPILKLGEHSARFPYQCIEMKIEF